jgi:transcription antitermination factor NusA-like protein
MAYASGTVARRVVAMPGDETEILIRLFEQEVPEVAAGVVLIKAGARKPGFRSKLAVYSRDPGVDCIGVCVGQRGCRIQGSSINWAVSGST